MKTQSEKYTAIHISATEQIVIASFSKQVYYSLFVSKGQRKAIPCTELLV